MNVVIRRSCMGCSTVTARRPTDELWSRVLVLSGNCLSGQGGGAISSASRPFPSVGWMLATYRRRYGEFSWRKLRRCEYSDSHSVITRRDYNASLVVFASQSFESNQTTYILRLTNRCTKEKICFCSCESVTKQVVVVCVVSWGFVAMSRLHVTWRKISLHLTARSSVQSSRDVCSRCRTRWSITTAPDDGTQQTAVTGTFSYSEWIDGPSADADVRWYWLSKCSI